ncbi:MAG: hypothetical protein KC910_10335 [Candidatus Eremiobacteraeota bacterium]|nr:hypothetical protein [Candidatus Eremiobacteraeota bacterium]
MRPLVAGLVFLLGLGLGFDLFGAGIQQAMTPRPFTAGQPAPRFLARTPEGQLVLTEQASAPGYGYDLSTAEMLRARQQLGLRIERLEYRRGRTLQRFRLEYSQDDNIEVCVYDADPAFALPRSGSRLTSDQSMAWARRGLAVAVLVWVLGTAGLSLLFSARGALTPGARSAPGKGSPGGTDRDQGE